MFCYFHIDDWAFSSPFCKSPRLCTFASLSTLCKFSEKHILKQQLNHARAHFSCNLCCFFLGDMCFLVSLAAPLFVLFSDDGQMDLPLEAHLDLTW